MSCLEVRLDVKDFNGIAQTVAPLMKPSTGTKVYCVWAGRASSGASSLHNHEVLINYFDSSDHSVGDGGTWPVQIQADIGINTDPLGCVILDDNTMLVGFGGGVAGVRVVESTDLGLTWATSADVGGAFSAGNNQFVALLSDGTDVWVVYHHPGGGTDAGDMWAHKRTGPGTWGSAVKIHDASGSSVRFAPETAVYAGCRVGAMKSATQGLMVMDYTPSASGFLEIRCLYTLDGWASLGTVVTLKTYVASNNRNPNVVPGTDGRVRVSWTDETIAPPANRPFLAYTDDWGKTWTLVGSPSAFASAPSLFAWDPTFDRGMFLGAQNDWYMSTFDNTLGTVFHLYKGGDLLTGWTETTCDGLAFGPSTDSSGDGFIADGNWYREFTRNNGGVHNVNILFIEGADTTGGGGAPPLVAESASQSDVNDTILVLDIADDRGWSARDLQVGCFAIWNQGDYTTERRKRFLLAGAANLDPAIQDPNALIAIWKVEDPERWTKEAFEKNADTSITPVADPLLFEWHSEELNLGPQGSQNIVRMLYVKYRRESVPVSIQVWVDGVHAQTCVLPPSWPNPAEGWFPVGGDDAVGTRVQFRVEDREDAALDFEVTSVKYIQKRWRA